MAIDTLLSLTTGKRETKTLLNYVETEQKEEDGWICAQTNMFVDEN